MQQETVWIWQPLSQAGAAAQPPQAGAGAGSQQAGAGAGAQHGFGLQHFTLSTLHFAGLQGLQQRLPASAVLASSMAAARPRIIPSERIVSSLQSNPVAGQKSDRPATRRVLKTTFRLREAFQTPGQPMFRDKNLSNNPPIFSAPPAIGKLLHPTAAQSRPELKINLPGTSGSTVFRIPDWHPAQRDAKRFRRTGPRGRNSSTLRSC